ncbi:LacI family DNA-binding transcriptional regulator [Bifidobacterium psychraerophilum]|jgi:LacI family transcriptional regulator|uniref:LacI family transcriptional regulator n=1 Tax=Bifidobacterium psychraerophilum TaxID=218140 RepID=A0A087CLZ6_9BIFI|nr:LacI family DNA-binding transcriptional regulator [Bifidobacterium psychraerophilum]KFI84296.1 LacI family transcriptional regulator [Bifidobacterium psychraerophilum]PKA94153.1 LacI family transcriptional regulator [Bifidobacterium psychraerophilum DSM 22366]
MSHRALTSEASISNVAALAGVSTATVSRVLSGRRKKDDELSKRVRQAAEKLNYSVNYAASALRSDITNIIAVIVPELGGSMYSRFAEEAESVISAQGKQLMLGIGGDAHEQEQRIRAVVSRHVDGIMVVPVETEAVVELLEGVADHTPVVQVFSQAYSNRLDWVGTSNTLVMQLIAEHLSASGARSVAYLGSSTSDVDGMGLFTAFHMQMTVSGLTTQTDWIRFGSSGMDYGFTVAQEILSEGGQRPDSIICADGMTALGVVQACRSCDLEVPGDIKLVVLQDSALCEDSNFSKPSLTAVRLPWMRIAGKAMELISVEHESKSWLPSYVEMEPSLVIRESSAAS